MVGVGEQRRRGRIADNERVGRGRHVETERLRANSQLERTVTAPEQIVRRLEPAVLALAGQRPGPGDGPRPCVDARQIGAVEPHTAPLFGNRHVLAR